MYSAYDLGAAICGNMAEVLDAVEGILCNPISFASAFCVCCTSMMHLPLSGLVELSGCRVLLLLDFANQMTLII